MIKSPLLKSFSQRDYFDAPSKTHLKKLAPGDIVTVETSTFNQLIKCEVLYRRGETIVAEIKAISHETTHLQINESICFSIDNVKSILLHVVDNLPKFMSVSLKGKYPGDFVIHNFFPRFIARVVKADKYIVEILKWYDVPLPADDKSALLSEAAKWYYFSVINKHAV